VRLLPDSIAGAEPMKAAVLVGKGRMELTDMPVPDPGPGQVLLKVLGCGVCGTDAYIYTGQIQNAKPPVVIAHEIYGEVERLGDGVSIL
jgi:D-arabinose 1-dehydrogenase-like Zn-dependent alcohol dehydrogenase